MHAEWLRVPTSLVARLDTCGRVSEEATTTTIVAVLVVVAASRVVPAVVVPTPIAVAVA